MSLNTKIITAITLTIVPIWGFATAQNINDFMAITTSFGGRYSDEIADSDSTENAQFSNDFSYAIAATWHYDRDSEGELLYSNAKQRVNTINGSTDLYISYLHLGGKAIFRNDTPLSTSVSVGFGATLFIPDNSRYDSEIDLSGNISIGARYQLNQQWALKTDLRIYGTVLNNGNRLLCDSNSCLINVEGEVFIQTELLTGIEYKF